MLLPLWDGLVRTTPFDQECARLADRHYTRPPRSVGSWQFAASGRKIVLRDGPATVLFVWRHEAVARWDGERGYNNVLFRNESGRRSSEIILEAERWAVREWGPGRAFTYVDPAMVRSRNPGYCFKRAGWRFVRVSKSGKHLLEKELEGA